MTYLYLGYICDIDRARFDNKANLKIKFDKHTRQDHYMWNYVFFLVYLYRKDSTEYTGIEQYIADLIERDDLSFFPVLRSLVLEEAEQRDREMQKLIAAQFEATLPALMMK